MVADQAARTEALNTRQSYIVQAPAGSGKTELLIQRILALLAERADKPEEIIAITFTKKAAGEMHERVVEALQLAENQPKPEEPHKQTTWQLGQKVLEKNHKLNWHLLENTHRLNILTIDSLALMLTKQMPLLSGFGAQPSIAELPNNLYHEAAQLTLDELNKPSQLQPHIRQLLFHLNNNLQLAEQLLARLLGKREQWLNYIIPLQSESLDKRAYLEASLQNIISDHLKKLNESVPEALLYESYRLVHYAECMKYEKPYQEPTSLKIPLYSEDAISFWMALANILITQKFQWRSQIDKRQGFPSAIKGTPPETKALYKAMKVDWKELLNRYQEHPEILPLLEQLFFLPLPNYQENQWQLLDSLLNILPHAAARLNIVFQQKGKIDFAEINIAAQRALGDEDNPSDLSMSLDYQIKHLLVDEFQDTSVSQVKFLKRLTDEWSNQEQTLFMVGDPMQSIYRFREAEVSLFLNCQHHQSFGSMSIKPLHLTVNFRSDSALIHWFNEAFEMIFPDAMDPELGKVTYAQSIPASSDSKLSANAIQVDTHLNQVNVSKLIDKIKSIRTKKPEDSIAILVRSRSHLLDVISTLRSEGLAYDAVEIETLTEKSIIQDLYTLTKALLHLADTTAWLSLLRAPWLGLTLKELTVIQQLSQSSLIWPKLKLAKDSSELSSETKLKLNKLTAILDHTIDQRGRKHFGQLIEETWLQLGGPATVKDKETLPLAQTFFDRLNQLCESGNIENYQDIYNCLSDMFANIVSTETNPIQIMTIHKSKGLEFDHVFLLGLDKKPQHDPHQLLLWGQRVRDEATDFILAPMHAHNNEPDSVYRYLRHIESQRSSYEAKRLLYVAATRAKQHLHIIATLATEPEEQTILEPNQGSFLAEFWPMIKESALEAANANNATDTNVSSTEKINTKLNKLSSNWQLPQAAEQLSLLNARSTLDPVPYQLTESDTVAAQVGTMIHRVIEQISKVGMDIWQQKPIDDYLPSWQRGLERLNIPPAHIESSLTKLKHAIQNILKDKQGQWILSNLYQHHGSEQSFSYHDGQQFRTMVIDRLLLDDNNDYWIVDYKTSENNIEQPHEKFLQNEWERYKMQLENYAEQLSHLIQKPINLGLYFPMLPAWKEWKHEV